LGERVVAVADSNVVYLYDLESRLATRYEGHTGRVSAITVPGLDFERVLVGDVNGTVRVWKVPPRDARVVLRAAGAVYGAAFSPDGKTIATDGSEGIVRRIGLNDRRVTELRGHSDIVVGTRFSPVGGSFVSWSKDGTIRVWGPTGMDPLRVVSDHAGIVGGAGYIEGGRRIMSIGDDGRLLAWPPDGGEPEVLFEHGAPLHALEILDARRAVVSDSMGAIWQVATDRATRRIRQSDGVVVTALRVSPDGSLLAVGMADGAVTVHETTGYEVLRQETMAAGIRRINFDPKGRDLLIASEDGHVRMVALDRRREIPWRDLPLAARDVAYSNDGDTIAFVCKEGGAWFYSIPEDRWVYVRDHAVDVISGRFSQIGADFASADRSGTVIVRDVVKTFARGNQ
ncbi:MAG TPA: WD40 repeat domain-containing protein, partial [Gemmatimonadaceae bacterium]|nr:WD40 repeat domain-containing protein [Gemmatimonadaceae bacterium]